MGEEVVKISVMTWWDSTVASHLSSTEVRMGCCWLVSAAAVEGGQLARFGDVFENQIDDLLMDWMRGEREREESGVYSGFWPEQVGLTCC